MAGKIYGLLIGINAYPDHVGRLYGCVNDVDHFHAHLKRRFGPSSLAIEVLKDGDATRDNVIRLVRTHLGKASSGDVAVMQYSGHGARWRSAPEFAALFPEGMDEGLVCVDSREPGGYDLADKELAILLAEVAAKEPHLAVMFDCCHSGSATRGADELNNLRVRQTHTVDDPRPLESYLDGYYADQLRRAEAIAIPEGRHILLAACDRYQKALEGHDRSGVFTSTLLEVLDKSGTEISYADLFVKCRAAVRKRVKDQDPQFETRRGFGAYQGFLGSKVKERPKRFMVHYDSPSWQVAMGAMHGLPTDNDRRAEFDLFRESDPDRRIGRGLTRGVGAQKSDIRIIDCYPAPDTDERLEAELTSLPVPPLAVDVEGTAEAFLTLRQQLDQADDATLGFALWNDQPQGSKYALRVLPDRYELVLRESGKVLQGSIGHEQDSAEYLFEMLKKIAAWERGVALANPSTKFRLDDVPLKLHQLIGDKAVPVEGDQITIDVSDRDGGTSYFEGMFTAANQTRQPLHLALLHYSESFGVDAPFNDVLPITSSPMTVTLEGENRFTITLEANEGDQAVHRFKLIVAAEPIDDFLLVQDPIEIGAVRRPEETRGRVKGFRPGEPEVRKLSRNEWFTKDFTVRLVKTQGEVGPRDVSVAGGRITIKGHPKLRANISLGAAKSAARGVGADFALALERQGMELVDFAPTRSVGGVRGDDQSVLEISDIRNPEVLADEPLEIEIEAGLGEDEYLLPIAFDGEHLHFVGHPSKTESGKVSVSIDEIPEVADDRRSIGRAIKFYFFKSYLKFREVNRLAWIEYKDDGTFERHDDGVKEKVAKSKRVLLLIHGIIGNTDGIVEGLKLARDGSGRSVDQKYDVVLTYDYENLSTPIEETARELKRQLGEVGLRVGDDRELVIVCHSMGGLVSRWFIEQEGGKDFVDELVMFGTPNVGSPFGRVDMARDLMSMLTTLAINTFPAVAAFGGALVYLLTRSKKLTPTLEQMHPDSEFITKLKRGADPRVRYRIIAGDVRHYDASGDAVTARLVAKLGRGKLFGLIYGNRGHDIAVADESILGVDDHRIHPAQKDSVICHHMNYFASDAGLAKLRDV